MRSNAGFRTDKIPLSMLVTQAGGQRTFKMTILEEIMLRVVPLALEQSGDLVVTDSERIASKIDDLAAAYDPKKPLTIDIEYEMMPPIVWARSYKDAAVSVK
jgi:FKBP-type peptidyl-prolyl cis-trans isomerase (trigger factor)